jgi:hypothetical protein
METGGGGKIYQQTHERYVVVRYVDKSTDEIDVYMDG